MKKKKPKKKKFVWCNLPMYNALVIGLLGYKPKEASEWVWKRYRVHEKFEADGQCTLLVKDRDKIAIISTKLFSKAPPDLAVLVHECLHAALLILKEVGQGVDTGDHEHLTYLQQHIFQELLTQRLAQK